MLYYLIFRSHLNLASCLNTFFIEKESSLESNVALNIHLSLVFFNMKEFLGLHLTFMTLTLMKITDYFIKCPINCVCLMCPCNSV